MVASPTLLFASGQTADGAWKLLPSTANRRTGGSGGSPWINEIRMSSWMHEGKQYIIIQLNDGLAAMALP